MILIYVHIILYDFAAIGPVRKSVAFKTFVMKSEPLRRCLLHGDYTHAIKRVFQWYII